MPLTTFLEGLRVAWREGEVRPTAQPKPSKPRYRTVPDPLAAVTTDLKAWFDEEPGITGAALLERLQQRHAGAYPDHLIRTVQRRVKVWRQERARALVLDLAAATGVGAVGSATWGSALGSASAATASNRRRSASFRETTMPVRMRHSIVSPGLV